jgi:hypothetical protein
MTETPEQQKLSNESSDATCTMSFPSHHAEMANWYLLEESNR